MAALRPELLLPAHGLPIGGEDRIQRVLDETATVLESLVTQTLDLMNAGATLDTIVHTVRVPSALLERPYLQPVYDEPEFVVRNIWRLYGGWYDGNPARLKPAPDAELATEVARLAGGAPALADRALALVEAALAASAERRRRGKWRRRVSPGLPAGRVGRTGRARRPRCSRGGGRRLPGSSWSRALAHGQGHLRRGRRALRGRRR